MGRAPALLRSRRAAAFAAVAALLALYYAFHESLPNVTTWWDVAILALLVLPAVFALVWALAPLWDARGVAGVGLAFAAVAVAFHLAGVDSVASFAKLGAATFLGWWFLSLFESVAWVVLVALLVPWVDAFSVARGPTNEIVRDRPGLFDALSFGFPFPGQDGTARLGIPDLVFFALFLAATLRFVLRPAATWLLMVASFGLTMLLAVAWDPIDLGGLPALPLLSIAFLVANGDLLWRRMRARGRTAESP